MDKISYFKRYIKEYPDFPKPGILFRDITPLLRDFAAFYAAVYEIKNIFRDKVDDSTVIVAPEARGFIFGVPVAHDLQVPFVPVRKPGKLPGNVVRESYTLEYGEATLEVSEGSIKPGDKVVIIDDLLATGGTLKAIATLVEKMGGEVIHIIPFIELSALDGRSALKGYDVTSVVTFDN